MKRSVVTKLCLLLALLLAVQVFAVSCNKPQPEAPTEEPTTPQETPTEPPVEMTVTTNYVNVRSGPDTGYDKVRQLHKGDKILVYETKTVGGREWGRLEDGWVCLDYVTLEAPDPSEITEDPGENETDDPAHN